MYIQTSKDEAAFAICFYNMLLKEHIGSIALFRNCSG